MKDPILRKAKKRVKQKKDFFTHAGVMIVVSIFLLFLSIFIGRQEGRFMLTEMLIPIAAMALSVAIHYVSVWGIPGVGHIGDDWEAKELEKEYLRLKRLSDTKKNLSDEEYLELRELELRYKDEDFV